MPYCEYLRKSRSDAEAEARGEGETLARHERLLAETARRMKIEITEVYREVVSGETITARPEMLRLLEDVERGKWDGVLVVEVERLARGDSIDQGIVARSFKFSDTKIITPQKIYDPNNEFDEEYFEFGLFMSRREYKTINRRLQSGRVASVKEGKFVGNKPPYGYQRVKLEHDKGFTLEPIPEQAEIVKMIFVWYGNGKTLSDGSVQPMGVTLICRELQSLKIPNINGQTNWSNGTIKGMLINPAYIGKVRWNCRPQKKKVSDGLITRSRPRAKQEDWIVANGLHPAIVDEDLFYKIQEKVKDHPQRPGPKSVEIKNPLSGLIKCSMCGHSMSRRPYADNYPDTLLCQTLGCPNVSARLDLVEKKLLEALEQWLKDYKLKWNDNHAKGNLIQADFKVESLSRLEAQIKLLKKQREQVYDFLERGIYNTEEFLERSRALSEKIAQVNSDHASLHNQIEQEKKLGALKAQVVPKIENVLQNYHQYNILEKNNLLKEILHYVKYTKTTNGRWHDQPDNFTLEIYPRLPKVNVMLEEK